MSEVSDKIRVDFAQSDKKRDEGLTSPKDVVRYNDILYGSDAKWQRLDVYRPKSEMGKLPVIINVHGGGWVYGDKEVYQFYCMSLAQRGFAVVNYTYRLAPEYQYPAGIEDLNTICQWVLGNKVEYGFDCDRIFAVGDSAGAHQLAIYGCILSNPEYAASYPFRVPEGFKLRAVALNCGKYLMDEIPQGKDRDIALMADLLPKKGTKEEFHFISPLYYMTADFPPAYVMTAKGDFLMEEAPLLAKRLEELGVKHVYRCYGTKKEPLCHVFHCNMRLEEAKLCNDEECQFFGKVK